MPSRAMLQLFNIGFIEGELRKICGLRRIAEFLDGKVTRNLAKRVDIGSELKVLFGSRLYEYRAKYEDLVGAAGAEDLGERLARTDISDLIITQAGEFPKELSRL